MARTILAAALLGLAALPALAADPVPAPDPITDNVIQQWQAKQTADRNVQSALAAVLQERGAMQQQIAKLREQCGEKCKEPAPQAQASPAKPEPMTPTPAPSEPPK